MHQLKQLLDNVAFKIATVRKAKDRFADQLAPEFRIFDYLRTDEMGLSRCIASLLDPKGTHGQRSVFLDAFLENIFPEVPSWAKQGENCQVTTEKQANAQRRIDVYLKFPNGVIGIENKPWAGDQDQQLTDYADYLKRDDKNWLLLFLSNRDPSERSIDSSKLEELEKGGQFVQRNYGEIIEWLGVCACKSKALVVRIFIEELAKFIRMNINGELDMSEEKEIQQTLLESPQNIESAFHVLQTLPSVKKELLERFRKDLKGELASQDFLLVWDPDMEKNWKCYIGFGVKIFEKQGNYLRFEFQSSELNRLIWGIRRENELPVGDPIGSKISDMMKKRFGLQKSSRWWAWYSDALDDVLDADMQNWGISPRPWTMIMDKGNDGLAKKISKLAKEVHDIFAENIDLLNVKK